MKQTIILILALLISLPAIFAIPSLPIEVWGTIDTDLPVSITVNGQTYDNSINQDGYYRVLIEDEIELETKATVLVNNNITKNIILNSNSIRYDINTIEIQLLNGWNLISIPSKDYKEISDMGCKIIANGWEWNNEIYKQASKITFPKGIWLYKYSTSQCTTINSYDTEITQINLKKNWNLIGVPFETSLEDFIGDCIISGYAWWWDSWLSTYRTVYPADHESTSNPDGHIMKPGIGYWVFSKGVCTLSRSVARGAKILESDISPGSGFGSTTSTTTTKEIVEEEETVVEEIVEEEIVIEEVVEEIVEEIVIEESTEENTIFTTNVDTENYNDKDSWISINNLKYHFEKAKECTQTNRCLVDECSGEKPCRLTETSSGLAIIDYDVSNRLILCEPCADNKFSQIYYKSNR